MLDIEDVFDYLPGMLEQIKEWFRVYKVAEGKQENEFALEGLFQDKEFAKGIIEECYANLFDMLPKMYAKQEGTSDNLGNRRRKAPKVYDDSD